MIQFANRLNSVQEYYFSKKLREVRQLATEGKPIINIGIGSPDLQPPSSVIEAIKNSLFEDGAHKYQSYQGLTEFRKAVSSFYQRNYDVALNSENEVLPLMGSKEGIMHISLAFLNKGDQVLIPNPGYPTYSSVTNLIGATPIFYELDSNTNWQPNFSELEKLDTSKIKLMWVNYPHMPTGAKATNDTFEKLIAFGKKHNIVIVNDNPYSFILNDNLQSILKVNGAKDIALELNSLSKSFNMSGWRVGMLLGKQEFLTEVLKVKTQMDSGMFYGIQKGAIEALQLSNDWFKQLNSVYTERRELVWALADKLKCTYHKDNSGMFVWAKLPSNITSEKMIDDLLYNKNIFVAPGTVFGSKGEGYIRFSLCVPKEKIKEAINRI
ncbi:aminotransferase class I/II-fold pyridoxal phosphate-dependent enzyme [Tenacibaculum sp. S7007]|uniref:Aminotransferase n=1 Tax=Tenacibaculum pelagium TaxID=2759527 RepID=A0A839AL42_9FLAO|nr:aminotransferase class I/II-fold pyridoxal phosphate-dependent enzyme [Tenacibaculum pelagium]MBA6155823.1 aminotransferase class I/II-fold pyridoxal phosphate-dependent enzyme [Tenacibaculum pelagium]